MSPEAFPPTGKERQRFVEHHAISEDGESVIAVHATYYKCAGKELRIVPATSRIRRYDEMEQYGPVLAVDAQSTCMLVVAKEATAQVFELAYLQVSKGSPGIEAVGWEILQARTVYPQIKALPPLETGRGLLTVPLTNLDWVKILFSGEISLTREIAPLDIFSDEQINELQLPARWIRLVNQFRAQGE